MKLIEYIPGWLKNKYSIALIVFVIWVMFFDRNDMITQIQRRAELRELEKSATYYEQETQLTLQELRQLDSSRALREKYAREKYFMKKPGEILFVIPDPQTDNKNR